MGWHLTVTAPACSHCGHGEEVVYSRRLSFNVAPMLRRAWRGTIAEAETLYALNEKSGAEAAPLLAFALAAFADNAAEIAALQPVRGGNYGSYADTLDVLRALHAAALQYPAARVGVR